MTTPTADAAKDAAREAAKIPTGILDFLIKPATLSADALNAVAKGGLNFGNVLPAVGAELTKLGSIGGLAGKGLKIFGEYAQESVDAMRNFSKVGAGFSGDAIGMRASIAQTNMSLEQYGKFLNTNSVLLTAMGGSVSKGATAFNTFSKDFFAATGDVKKGLGTFGDQLINLGMNAEEINGVLALEVSARRFNDIAGEPGRLAAIEAAKALAEEMDKTSKLSGKSREEQQKSLIALERDGKYQAAIRLQMMDGNKFAAEGMISAMSKVEKFGSGVQNLVKDITSFGTASKDTAGTLSSLGPAGTQLQNAINMTKTARTEEQKAAAAKAVSDAEMAIQIQLNSRIFTQASSFGIKGFQDLANQTTTLTAGLEKIAVEQGLNLNIESDRRKAAQKLNDKLKADQLASQGTAKPREEDRGKATTQMVIQFESSLQKASSAVNDQIINRLNTEIAPEMNKFMLKLRAMSDQDLKEKASDMYDEASTAFRKPANPDPATAVANAEAIAAARVAAVEKERQTPNYQRETNPARRTERENIAADEAERKERARIERERERPATTNPMASARGADRRTPVYVEPVNGQLLTRAGGSLEMAGKMFEDWGKGTMVELHGLESVMRPQDLSKVIESAMGGVRKTMPKIDVGAAGNNIETPKFDMPDFEMPNIDLSKLSQSITTSLSSVSGGGSTTNRQVQNDSSKAAEKELASVREQMQAERTVLRQKLKDTIGDGSKSGGNAVAKEMRIGDESKAITDKYNAIMEPLQKQIDAGKSSETVREEAKAETIKIIEEQIAITKTGNSTIADMYRNNSKDKLSAAKQDAESLDDMYKDDSKAKLDLAKQRNEALFKAAELAKDVVGTSVKDMSDSVFESMIPKGAKIEDYYEDMNGKLQSYSLDTVAKLEKLAKDSANTIITEEEAIVEARVAIKKTEKQMTAAESLGIDSSPFKKSLQAKQDALNKLIPAADTTALPTAKIMPAMPQTESMLDMKPAMPDMNTIFKDIAGKMPKPEELNALMPKPEAISGIFSNLFGNIPKPEELNALMPKPEAISGIFSNLFGNIPKPEELNALMPKPEAISGIFSNLFKTVPKLAATAEQKVDPNQADNDDAEMGAAIRANAVTGKSISAAPVEIDNPEAAMGAGKYSPVKPNATPAAGKDPFARMLDRFMGPMSEPGKALAPAEAAKTSVTSQSDAAAKAEARRIADRMDAEAGANTTGGGVKQGPKTDKPITGSKESTLSDVVKSLDTLNMQVGQLAGTMSQLPYLMEKSVSATKSLNGNLNARVT